ncbi:MAG: hemolysin III family protein [bacterium]
MDDEREHSRPRERFERAAERVADAKDAAVAHRDAAIEAGREAIARVKPRGRGVSHEWAFFLSLGLGTALIAAAEGTRATVAVAIYAVSLSALFGVSALYHRVDWQRPEVRRWMRRLDHTMIFLLIAGSITPFALLLLEGTFAKALLIAVWAAALAGIVVELIWVDAPKWVAAIVYSAVGLIGAVAYPEIVSKAGLGAALLIAAGGALYLGGAVVYAVERPDPSPAVFGYHEVFHVLVIAAAAAHFAAIAFYALPAA